MSYLDIDLFCLVWYLHYPMLSFPVAVKPREIQVFSRCVFWVPVAKTLRENDSSERQKCDKTCL